MQLNSISFTGLFGEAHQLRVTECILRRLRAAATIIINHHRQARETEDELTTTTSRFSQSADHSFAD
jgi:hypothetical protein